MKQQTIRDRLQNPQTMNVYRNMIKNSSEEVVNELMNNIRQQAEGHPKLAELETLYDYRFGNE